MVVAKNTMMMKMGLDLTENLKRYGGATFHIMRKYRDLSFASEPIMLDTASIEFFDKDDVTFSCECVIYNTSGRPAIAKAFYDWNECEFTIKNRDVLFVNGCWRKLLKKVNIKITPHINHYDGWYSSISIKIPKLKIEDLL